MVNWCDSWLQQEDEYSFKIVQWPRRCDGTQFEYMLSKKMLKYNTQGFQALFQHSFYKSHSYIAKFRLLDKQVHMKKGASNSFNSQSASQLAIVLDHSKIGNARAAEALWPYKVGECNFSLRLSDDIPALFQNMFIDGAVAKKFIFCRQKASKKGHKDYKKVDRTQDNLNENERQLKEDEKKVNEEVKLAEEMLENASSKNSKRWRYDGV